MLGRNLRGGGQQDTYPPIPTPVRPILLCNSALSLLYPLCPAHKKTSSHLPVIQGDPDHDGISKILKYVFNLKEHLYFIYIISMFRSGHSCSTQPPHESHHLRFGFN